MTNPYLQDMYDSTKEELTQAISNLREKDRELLRMAKENSRLRRDLKKRIHRVGLYQ